MVEVTYQMVLSTLQTAGILVGIFYYIMTLRNTQKTRELTLESQELSRKAQQQAAETRQAQLFMQLYREYASEKLQKTYIELMQMEWQDLDDFAKKYDSGVSADSYAKRYGHWNWFNGIGLLLRKNLVDADIVYDTLGESGAIFMWNKFEPIIRANREEFNLPHHLTGFEYLAGEMKKMRVSKDVKADLPESIDRYVE